MVPCAEFLSQERKAYYNRLSDRLTEMCYAAVNAGDWERVIECAKLHLELNRCADYEKALTIGSINAKLSSIHRFCKEDGWV